jgi:hypothetical protein
MHRIIILKVGSLQIALLKLLGSFLAFASIFQIILILYEISYLPSQINSVNSCFARASTETEIASCQKDALLGLGMYVPINQIKISLSDAFIPLFAQLSKLLIWVFWLFAGLILYRLHYIFPIEEEEFSYEKKGR